ncbi:hypothetical protein M0R45_018814 [Rubus argutus]|uniref:Uncharacterized protein n=1 Tax=Rubus argutus TaxID=59490 RepID=A0AAW1X585_RUBAR
MMRFMATPVRHGREDGGFVQLGFTGRRRRVGIDGERKFLGNLRSSTTTYRAGHTEEVATGWALKWNNSDERRSGIEKQRLAKRRRTMEEQRHRLNWWLW